MRATNVDRKDMMGLGKSDPFMVIHRGNGQNLFTPIHKTEVIMKNLNPVWKEFVLPLSRLNGGNPDLPIMFEVFDWDNDGGHDLIGQVITTQRELNTKKEFDIIEPNIQKKKGNKYKNSGILHVDLIQEYTIPTFLDYITRGTEINFIVGVDFTGSNGDPLSPQSLHYINHQNPNEYMTAIRAIGDIVAPYDPDQLIPAYGFGACFNGARQANHCFALNLNENNPNCFGIDGVLQAYVNIFPHITLSGPTHFSPILNRLISLAQPYANGEKYFLLLMITDGIITDLDNTIQTLKKAATLPISIIIVGVGAADFTAMEELDNDDNSLKISRDIVQFVPFRKFANQPIASLTKEVLAEVPKQLVQYMLSNNLSPRLPPFQQY